MWICLGNSAFASDTAKEKRWADQIVDGLIVGEAAWLQADGHKFLGIYAEHETDKPNGAVIVLHGSGVHPDWPDVVQPLRSELPAHGWATLSLQLPILANEADYKDYAPLFAEVPARIKAGIAYLNQNNYHNIAIVAHSLGSSMAASHLAKDPGGIVAFAAIGMSVYDGADPRMDNIAALEKIKLPVLDLYGSQDLEPVLNSVKDRARAGRKAGNKDYRQVEVTGANHFFQGLEADLVRRVKSWLSQFAGMEVGTPADGMKK
jgi:pimeloyl-ACP methyl ester carboxylesterase